MAGVRDPRQRGSDESALRGRAVGPALQKADERLSNLERARALGRGRRDGREEEAVLGDEPANVGLSVINPTRVVDGRPMCSPEQLCRWPSGTSQVIPGNYSTQLNSTLAELMSSLI